MWEKSKNSNAFTLLEVLISLTVVLLITSFLPLILKTVYHVTFETKGIHLLELDVLSQKVQYEARHGQGLSVSSRQLTIRKEDGRHITFELYQDKIRRRVGGTGHVIVLQRVKTFEVQAQPYGALLTIVGLDNMTYSIPIYSILLKGPKE
ncbi:MULTISPECIES: competence type IV pilus minor pilin ComGF [Bacillus]|uniref:competence type IV pilus minor pilin ComGF n=1 Tax=Bacillus TaxID=1386 RepID=UPI000BB940AA|nr:MULTISPECIES: competence type IV pilus minor pilin ComGF [Bacillus]